MYKRHLKKSSHPRRFDSFRFFTTKRFSFLGFSLFFVMYGVCTTFIWHFSLTCYGDILSKTAWNLKYSTVRPFLLCTFHAGYLPQRAYFKVVLVTKMSLNVSRIFFHPPLLFFSLTKLLFLEFP